MILKDNFYTILRKDVDAMAYDIRLNPAHTIYQAHFPGEPVTPGVCILQIARELLEDLLQRPLAVKSVKNMKFLSGQQVNGAQKGFVIEKYADGTTKKVLVK